MPRAPKVCAEPGCWQDQPCPTHARKPWAGSDRRQHLPKDWDRRRLRVLRRDPVCTICHAAPSEEVHHTGHRDDHHLDQLAGVCVPCHKTETQKEAQAARQRK